MSEVKPVIEQTWLSDSHQNQNLVILVKKFIVTGIDHKSTDTVGQVCQLQDRMNNVLRWILLHLLISTIFHSRVPYADGQREMEWDLWDHQVWTTRTPRLWSTYQCTLSSGTQPMSVKLSCLSLFTNRVMKHSSKSMCWAFTLQLPQRSNLNRWFEE